MDAQETNQQSRDIYDAFSEHWIQFIKRLENIHERMQQIDSQSQSKHHSS